MLDDLVLFAWLLAFFPVITLSDLSYYLTQAFQLKTDPVSLCRTYPYTGRKLVERLLTPPITWIHIWAWYESFRTCPIIGSILLLWYIRGWIKGYGALVKKHRYCGTKVWGAFLFDHCYPILDIYGWCTLKHEAWLTRRDSD